MSREEFKIKNLFFIDNDIDHFESFKQFLESKYDVKVFPDNIISFLESVKPITHYEDYDMDIIKTSQQKLLSLSNELDIDLFLIDKQLDAKKMPKIDLAERLKNVISRDYFYFKITGNIFGRNDDEIIKPNNDRYDSNFVSNLLTRLNGFYSHYNLIFKIDEKT